MQKGVLIIILIGIFAAAAFGATIYVDDLADGKIGHGSQDDPFRDPQGAFNAAADADTIAIMPGVYRAIKELFIDSLCGNCERQRTKVKASTGFVIRDKGLIITGSGTDSTILVTNAGYGVYFENSLDSRISDLQITGGVRDLDGASTDAGIVARWSRLTVKNCLISDNTNRPDSVVVGIGGIMGREGAELVIENNRIINNTWDGIALYRGATAYIADNIINGGRGAGIGITWDATAIAVRNRISNYWKGIGSFGDPRVVAANNAVFDNLGWGIIATGTSYMDATNNVVYHNGNCGMAIWGDDCTGRFSNNIVADNGWRDEWVCPCVGIWNAGKLFNFDISYNDVWNNKAGQYRDMPDPTENDGNLSIDPKFSDTDSFTLAPDSPLIDQGNPLLTDPDGSPSDIGLLGGPRARLAH
jgi:parallel beta-helix repeat protein